VGGMESPADNVARLGKDDAAASVEGDRGEAMGEATCGVGMGAGCPEDSSSSSRRAP
jgi:hypothetical protein